MESEISSGFSLAVVLLALGSIICLGFGVFAITKAEAGVTVETLQAAITRKELDFETIKNAFQILAFKCKDCMGSFILILIASILEILRHKKKIVDDVLIDSTTKKEFLNRVINRKLPMIEISGNGYNDGDQLIAIYNTDKISLMSYIRSKHSIKSQNLIVVKHGEIISLNDKVEKSGAYYKIGNVLIPRNKIALYDGETVKDIKIYAKYKDMYKITNVVDGLLLKDFEVIDK